MTVQAERTVVITDHVREQAQRRFGVDDAVALDVLITRDIQTGQQLNHKPKPFRLYRETGRQLLGNQRFVMSANGQRGYLIDRAGGKDVVITALLRVKA